MPGVVHVSEMPARARVLEDGAGALSTAQAAAWVPAQVNGAPSGRPLALLGAPVADGLGVLAGARLALRLDGGYARFRSRVGAVAAPRPGRQDAVTVRVVADGRLLFERTDHAAIDVDVPVTGATTLELVTDGAPTPVEIAWADARLARE
jgi:hypothetical protein